MILKTGNQKDKRERRSLYVSSSFQERRLGWILAISVATTIRTPQVILIWIRRQSST
jgi:hypothetical protein